MSEQIKAAIAEALEAIKTDPHHRARVCAGIVVERREDVGDVALVYGGFRESFDKEAVLKTAREVLQYWPEPIMKLEIYVDERQPGRVSEVQVRTELERARLKRERRAKRPHGRA